MDITALAARLLKEKLAQACLEAGGLDMIDISPESVDLLKERLIKSCFELGIGFRLFMEDDELSEETLILKMDKVRKGDEIVEANGVKVFIDPAIDVRTAECELDYIGNHSASFVIK